MICLTWADAIEGRLTAEQANDETLFKAPFGNCENYHTAAGWRLRRYNEALRSMPTSLNARNAGNAT